MAPYENNRLDEAEAGSILSSVVEDLRARSYADLVQRYLDQEEHTDVAGASGTTYQVEVQAFWDDPRRPGNLMVIVSIDDGSFWRAVSPRTSSFIVAPDGSFVGE